MDDRLTGGVCTKGRWRNDRVELLDVCLTVAAPFRSALYLVLCAEPTEMPDE